MRLLLVPWGREIAASAFANPLLLPLRLRVFDRDPAASTADAAAANAAARSDSSRRALACAAAASRSALAAAAAATDAALEASAAATAAALEASAAARSAAIMGAVSFAINASTLSRFSWERYVCPNNLRIILRSSFDVTLELLAAELLIPTSLG